MRKSRCSSREAERGVGSEEAGKVGSVEGGLADRVLWAEFCPPKLYVEALIPM